METGDSLGIAGTVLGVATILFNILFMITIQDEGGLEWIVLGLLLLLGILFFLVVGGAGMVVSIIGVALHRSKLTIMALILSVAGFLWLLIPFLMLIAPA